MGRADPIRDASADVGMDDASLGRPYAMRTSAYLRVAGTLEHSRGVGTQLGASSISSFMASFGVGALAGVIGASLS